MSLLDRNWNSALPTLQEIDAQIERLLHEVQRLEEFREGVRLISSATNGMSQVGCGGAEDESAGAGEVSVQETATRMSAKDALVKVLRVAGEPLRWDELQRRVQSLPNPPSASAITSAYYHNTRSRDRCFLPIAGGYAGLTGRDEEWEPQQAIPGGEQWPSVKSLVNKFLRAHCQFQTDELVDAVLTENPVALEHTIRAQLSHAKKRGEARSVTRGVWASKICQAEDGGKVAEQSTPRQTHLLTDEEFDELFAEAPPAAATDSP